MQVVRPNDAFWHSETEREESGDLCFLDVAGLLHWDFYNQQIRGGVKALLVWSEDMN